MSYHNLPNTFTTFSFVCLSVLSDAVAYSNAFYGQGTVPVLLDDVRCIGTESRLLDCPYTTKDNCTHSQDAAISCTTSNELANDKCIYTV